jgi:hypothetical protein
VPLPVRVSRRSRHTQNSQTHAGSVGGIASYIGPTHSTRSPISSAASSLCGSQLLDARHKVPYLLCSTPISVLAALANPARAFTSPHHHHSQPWVTCTPKIAMSHSDHDPEQTRASRPQLLERLPFRMHDRELHGQYMKAPASQFANNHHRDPRTKQYPESLVLHGGARVRSPTESSMSTLSSAPDSATTCPLSALGSPLSSSYASDYHEYRDIIAGSRPASRVHRHKPSDGTCSTFVNDDEDATYFAVAPYCPEKNSAHPDGAMPAAEIVHQSRPQR